MSESSDSEVEFNIPSGIGQGDGAQNPEDKDSVYEGDTEDENQVHNSFRRSRSPTDVPDLEPIPNSRRRRDADYLGIQHEGRNSTRVRTTPRYDNYMTRPAFNSRGPTFKPEAFNGDEDWDSYISHFEICAEMGGWSQREKALALVASLKGQARMYYMNLAPLERASYNTVVYKLGQRFGNLRQDSMWIARLESRKRQPGESMAALGDDLRRMARRAYASFDPQAQETLALNQLYRTVSSEMKYRCVAAQCRTIADAVELIETYEGIVGEEKKKSTVRRVENSKKSKNEQSKPSLSSQSNNKIEKTLEQLVQRLDRLEERGNRPRSMNYSQGPRVCFKCQSPDHFIRNCPHNKEQQQEMQRKSVNSTANQMSVNVVQGNDNPST